jgi:hypothetical protein
VAASTDMLIIIVSLLVVECEQDDWPLAWFIDSCDSVWEHITNALREVADRLVVG